MIDTKIACQCGNRFKFGMDLVNGRAPDGLVCPTCGAPATPACNALLDFLAGKDPAPPSNESRPLKEIKISCSCGSRYKFDIELAEREMPSAVVCPGCQAELTPLANEEIRNYIANHPLGAAASSAAAAPTPAPVAAEPPVVAATPAPAPAAPAAPVTPPATPGAASAEISDPFGPAPTGKSHGPNLKPLEVPKHTRPAPGTKPAAPAHKPSAPAAAAAAAAHAAKPGAAKPGATKAVAKPAATSRQPNMGMGIAGAAVGAIIGAVLWFVFLKSTSSTPIDPKSPPFTTTWMAIVVGVLAGVGARLLGRTSGPTLGGASCVCATLTILIMAWQSMNAFIDRNLAPQLKSQYEQVLANAIAATKANDAQLKELIARTTPSTSMDGRINVTDDDLRRFQATQLPAMRDLAAGKPSREAWQASKRASLRSYFPFEDAWGEAIGIIGLLFLLGGILAAAKIPMK